MAEEGLTIHEENPGDRGSRSLEKSSVSSLSADIIPVVIQSLDDKKISYFREEVSG